MKYFATTLPVNADLKRHAQKERELRARIAELEERPLDPLQERYLAACRAFLSKLLQSKAEVASKIGRKK